MHFRRALLPIPGLIFLAAALSACGLGAAMESCPDCGQVRLIEARALHGDIRIYSGKVTAAQVFHVRVRMDRGYARDFTLSRVDLRVGDRVEIRGGEPVVRELSAR